MRITATNRIQFNVSTVLILLLQIVAHAINASAQDAPSGLNISAADGAANKEAWGEDPRIIALVEQRREIAERVTEAHAAYLVRLCSLTPEQAAAVRPLAERAAEESLRAFAKELLPNETRELRRKRVRVPVDLGIYPPVPIVDAIDRAVLAAPGDLLTAEQQQKLRAESEKRDAFRKRTAIRALVEAIDQRLFLSGEQRGRLAESLLEGWDPRWAGSTPKLIRGVGHLPPVADELVLPVLNEDQAAVWAAVPRDGFEVQFRLDGASTNNAAALWATGVALPAAGAPAESPAE